MVSGKLPARIGLRRRPARARSPLPLQADELVDGQPQRLDRRLGPRVGLGDDGARRAGSASSRPTRRRSGRARERSTPLQPVRALPAEDLHGQVERHVVVVLAAECASWPTRISVCTAPGRSTTTTRRSAAGGSIGSTVGTVAARPVAERLLDAGHRLVDADVADDRRSARCSGRTTACGRRRSRRASAPASDSGVPLPGMP